MSLIQARGWVEGSLKFLLDKSVGPPQLQANVVLCRTSSDGFTGETLMAKTTFKQLHDAEDPDAAGRCCAQGCREVA